jgi:hypothetical protein
VFDSLQPILPKKLFTPFANHHHEIRLLFDPVHIFKNLYNNFRNYQELDFPEFSLGGVIVPPIHGLRYYASKGHPSFESTAAFLQIIRNWFNIVNVKSQFSGQKNRDERRDAVYFYDRHQLAFLRDFHIWLQRWSEMDGRGLSDQTFHHAKVTTLNFIHLANYLLDSKGLEYVLFGLIMSDCLEGRFGWDRQLCGGNYFNGSLQFLQAEKKIRLESLVKMGFLMNEVKDIFKSCNDATMESIKKAGDELLIKVGSFDFELDFNLEKDDEATIFYTAGAIVRGLLRRTKCTACATLLSEKKESLQIQVADPVKGEKMEFLALCNRGGLIKPSDIVQISCVHAWSLYAYLMKDSTLAQYLQSSPNPRDVFVHVFMKRIERSECTEYLFKAECQSGCQFKDLLRDIAAKTFNIKAKNFASAANDQIREETAARKRSKNHKTSNDSKKIKKLSSCK